jgi:hypothetical protein
MAWLTKGIDDLLLIILHAFYKQRMLVALKRTKVISILKHAIIEGESFSRLIVFSSFPYFSLFDMLFATGEGF